MKIEGQTWVKLRNGEKAWVIGREIIEDEWIGSIAVESSRDIHSWDNQGNHCLKEYEGGSRDIIAPWQDPPKPVVFEDTIEDKRGVPRPVGVLHYWDTDLAPFIGKRVKVTVEVIDE